MERKESIFEKIENGPKKKSPFDDLTIGDVLWPLVTFSVLVFLVIFVYVPFGLEIPSLTDEGKQLEDKVLTRQRKIALLNSLDNGRLDEAEQLLKGSLPDRFDVSVLASAVSDLAESKDLTQNDLTLRDEPALGFQSVEQEGEVKGLKALTGVFSFRGELQDINSFVDAVVKSSRLISIEKFELKAVPVQNNNGVYLRDEWNLDITLKAYSFEDYTLTRYEEPLSTLPATSKIEDLVGTSK